MHSPLQSRQLFFAALLPLLAASAQSQRAARILGRVMDAAGKPVVGANVTVHSQPVVYRSDLGSGTTLRTKSRRDGRFVVNIDAQKLWSAWATWVDGDGQRHATAIAEQLGDGTVIVLHDDGIARRKQTLVVRGLAAWADRAPLRFRIVIPSRFRFWHDVVLKPGDTSDSGNGELPFLPGRSLWLEVSDRDGYPLHNFELDVRSPETNQILIKIPPPVEIVARVRDFVTKKVIPDAQLEWVAFSWPLYAPLGSSRPFYVRDPGIAKPTRAGEDGLIRVRVCWPRERSTRRFYRDLIASAPKYARAYLRLASAPVRIAGPSEDKEDEQILEFELHRSREVGGQVLDQAGAAIAALPCYVSGNAYQGTEKNSYMNYAWRRLSTDENGRIGWTASLPTNTPYVVLAPSRQQLARLLPPEAKELLELPTPTLMTWVGPQAGTAAGGESFGNLGAGKWVAHEVIAQRSDGRAAARALVMDRSRTNVMAASSGATRDSLLSRRGRGLLVYPPGTHDILIIDLEDGGFATQTRVVTEEQASAVQRLEFDLQRVRSVPIEILDVNDKPVPGAHAYYTQVGAQVLRQSRGLLSRGFNAWAEKRGRTDSTGRGRLILPDEEQATVTQVRALWISGSGKHHYSPDTLTVDPTHSELLRFKLKVSIDD